MLQPRNNNVALQKYLEERSSSSQGGAGTSDGSVYETASFGETSGDEARTTELKIHSGDSSGGDPNV